MSVIENILRFKRAENNGQNSLWSLWSIAEKHGLTGRLTSAFVQIENSLKNSNGMTQNQLANSMMEAIEAVMYVQLLTDRLINQTDNARHVRYMNIAQQAAAVARNGGVMQPGMGSMGNDFTVAGMEHIQHVSTIEEFTTASSYDDPFRTKEQAEPVVVDTITDIASQPTQQMHSNYDVVPTAPVVKVETNTNYETLVGKNMFNYEYHELSKALNNSTNTVRAVASEVKMFTNGNADIEKIVDNFLASDRGSVSLDANGKFTIERKKYKFDVQTGSDDLQDCVQFNNLLDTLDEICEFDESALDVDDLVSTVSRFAMKLNAVLNDMCNSDINNRVVWRRLRIISNFVRATLNDAIVQTWSVTGGILPATYVHQNPIAVTLKDPLKDVGDFYEDIFVAFYMNESGIVMEESFLFELAGCLLKALRSCFVTVYENVNSEEDGGVEYVVSVGTLTYNIVLDCSVQTTRDQDRLGSVFGIMTQPLETICRCVDRYTKSAGVNIVAGNLHAKIVRSSDDSCLSWFTRIGQ